MAFSDWLIPLLLFVPLVGALIMLLPAPRFDDRRFACTFAFMVTAITFIVSLVMAGVFFSSSASGMQLAGHISWVPGFGLSFSYGIDGISLWLVLLATFMMPMLMLNSFTAARNRVREYFFWMLLLEAVMLGVFVTTDIISFYLCYELTLVPLYFLVGLFGRNRRVQAARVFFLYAFTGSMLTLAAILYVVWFASQPAVLGHWTFNIHDLYIAARQMSLNQQAWVLLAMVLGFGVKTPLFPLHTWMPFLHTETPRNGSVDVTGVLLKLGLYGLIRLAVPMTPKAVIAFAPYIGVLAVIGILYCALICWVQTDYKRLVAYSSISHMGFCILGLWALDGAIGAKSIGPVGSIFYLISQGLATGAMFLCVGMIYERMDTREMSRMSGLAKVMPVWAFFMVFFVLASVGLPGLNGFVGEFLTLMGTFISHNALGVPYAVAAAFGMIFAAMYLLYMTGRMVFGPVKMPQVDTEANQPGLPKDLTRREIALLAPIALACLWLGIYPVPMLKSLQHPMDALVNPAKAVAVANRRAAMATAQASGTTAARQALALDTSPWINHAHQRLGRIGAEH